MKIGFYGATGTVTGSKYLVESGKHRILVDCGLFQGFKQLRLRNWAKLPFPVRNLDAVVLTHAHLDHSGYLPLLIKKGFNGPVYCTAGTASLLEIMLPDSGRIMEEDAERANRRGYTKHRPALPLYTEKDAAQALKRLVVRKFHREFEAAPGLWASYAHAGHILGSATLRLRDASTSIGFTGDLGRPHDLIMRPPEVMQGVDWLVAESTYGNRRHPDVDAVERIGEVISRTVGRGGSVIVPAFAVGRTQALLWAIHLLKADGRIPKLLPVYLNSPMAIDVTQVYHHHRREHRLDDVTCQQMCTTAVFVNSVEESKRLKDINGPKIIIAGSGMATGGRVVHHLRQYLPDPHSTVLFTGFQAGGTRGASLTGGAKYIRMFGEDIPVKAEIVNVDSLSAHADYMEMIDWMRTLPRPPRNVFLTHGEPEAADSMRQHIERELGWNTWIPDYRDFFNLDVWRP